MTPGVESGATATIQHAQAEEEVITATGAVQTGSGHIDAQCEAAINEDAVGGDQVGGDKIAIGDIGPGAIAAIGHGASVSVTYIHEVSTPPIPLQRPLRTEHFTGREAELARLLTDLQPGCVVTLCGPGGISKTALAAEAIWTLAPGSDPPERLPDGIIFYTFYHQPQADPALEAIVRAFGEDPRPSPVAAAQRALANRRALVVLDSAKNADDLEAVSAVTSGNGGLMTTRRHRDAVAGWQEIIPLPNLKVVQLLLVWSGACAADNTAAKRICELVDGLPLAVRLVGRYLAQCQQEAADFLAWLEKTPLAASDLGRRQHESVPLVLERSLAPVSETARRVLAVAGLLEQLPFTREIIVKVIDIQAAEVGRSLGELVDHGLLLQIERCYQVSYALVHTYARQRLSPPTDAGTVDETGWGT